MAIVVDVSIAAAWCFPDERADAAAQVLEDLPRFGGVVPGLFWYEVRNVLVVNERRARIDPTDSARFLMRLRSLGLQRDDDHDEDTMMMIARSHALSAYDAAYLETATRRGDRLATLDRLLASAAVTEGVSVIHS
jgi:predicted nucleic acid-binding protein